MAGNSASETTVDDSSGLREAEKPQIQPLRLPTPEEIRGSRYLEQLCCSQCCQWSHGRWPWDLYGPASRSTGQSYNAGPNDWKATVHLHCKADGTKKLALSENICSHGLSFFSC